MMRDHYEFKRSLIEQKNRDAENARMEVQEKAYCEIGWLLVGLVVIAVIASLFTP